MTLGLPTEAQWEYACRVGMTSRHFTGDGDECLDGYANISDAAAKAKFAGWDAVGFDDGYVYTSPVGSFRPNEFGLYDMTGNVWEWCRD